ncbi:MAG: YtxH domain-containing protein [Anaerolineae bacterium]|nr:YtxH domain-containing protein [Anaerolineae bacterium]
MANNGNFGVFFNGFVIGGMVGTVMALLFAPQSGQRMRTEIKEKAETAYVEAQKKMTASLTELQTKVDKLSANVDQVITQLGQTCPTK